MLLFAVARCDNNNDLYKLVVELGKGYFKGHLKQFRKNDEVTNRDMIRKRMAIIKLLNLNEIDGGELKKKKLTNEEFIKIGYQKLSWTPANNCVVDEMAFTNHTDIFISKSVSDDGHCNSFK